MILFLRSIPGLLPLKGWLAVGALSGVLILYGAFKYQQHRADRAEADLVPAIATGKALDTVATQTPIIRDVQQEKQREVDQIQGSDARLPDDFGRDLQRVRDGRSGSHPR